MYLALTYWLKILFLRLSLEKGPLLYLIIPATRRSRRSLQGEESTFIPQLF